MGVSMTIETVKLLSLAGFGLWALSGLCVQEIITNTVRHAHAANSGGAPA